MFTCTIGVGRSVCLCVSQSVNRLQQILIEILFSLDEDKRGGEVDREEGEGGRLTGTG